MTTIDYIISKQINWATNSGISLTGSKRSQGRKAYTEKLKDNLFEPLDSDSYNSFKDADGNELLVRNGSLPKMQALHSSSALAVNIFHYWRSRNEAAIASACGLCREGNKLKTSITFEDRKCKVSDSFTRPPNIDVVIRTNDKIFGIESKFSEAYGGRKHSGIAEKYLNEKHIWEDIHNLEKLANSISPDDNTFELLHVAQLIKHILGLKQSTKGKSHFRLLYLYYDVMGSDSHQHLEEIKRFKEVTDADEIRFSYMSYQELIIKLANKHRANHPDYISYITSRYL